MDQVQLRLWRKHSCIRQVVETDTIVVAIDDSNPNRKLDYMRNECVREASYIVESFLAVLLQALPKIDILRMETKKWQILKLPIIKH